MKRLLSVTGFTALLTLLRMCTGFLIAKIIAIYTGPTGMAMLGQIQSVVSILNGIVNAPVGSGVVRYTSENINKGFSCCSPWWKASLQWAIGFLALIVPIGCLLSKEISFLIFDNSEYYWLIIISCLSLPLSVCNTLVSSVINGQQKYKRYVILGMISTLISTIIMIFLICSLNLKGALIAAAINTSISGLIMIITSLWQPWFKLKYWWGKTELENKKKIGGYVLMVMTTALSVPVSLIIVRNILISHVGWDLTGQWQAVWKISEVYISVITMSLSTYYLPRLSTLKKYDEIKSEVIKTMRVIIPIIVFLAFGVYILRDFVITLLFTDDFMEARSLFAIQLCGDVVKIAAWLFSYTMLSRGAIKWYISSEIIFSLSFVFFSYVFISMYGVQGVTIAYLVNYTCYFIFVYSNFKKIIG
ncbi:TPA: O-antigen translocase [Photobacterium damselae]